MIAYFSMEVGIEARVPTYSGGLGILAGDTIRAAAARAKTTPHCFTMHWSTPSSRSITATGTDTSTSCATASP